MAQWIKSNININFVGQRKKFWTLSVLAIVLSIGALLGNYFVRGAALNYGTDFKGGTQIQIEFAQKISVAAVRGSLAKAGYDGAEVVEMGGDEHPNLFLLRLTEVSAFSAEQQKAAKAALAQAFGANLSKFEYAKGADRVRLTFKRGYHVAPDAADSKTPASAPASQAAAPASAPASAPSAAVASSQPASQPAQGADEDGEGMYERTDLKRLRALLTGAGVDVQNVLQPGRAEDNRYEIVLGGLARDLRKAFGESAIKDIPQVEAVGPKMGQQLRDDGIKSVIYALLLMLVYIAIRFDFRYAPGAVIALAHDVIITIGLFAITWTEFSLPVVAALLTIAGYSINDTIVVFDRIRENVARLRDRKFGLVVNTSINETLSRTLLTSLTTLFTCISIWVVGTGVLEVFAFALTAGVVVGTYSSIFIASPIVVSLNERFAAVAKGRR
ncbi:MAG: protein translocase subunit SecF [Deltaproteobacteria bacterium]|nr:protein translocase subunit SecF [Deltaproteobacteria bacterium]